MEGNFEVKIGGDGGLHNDCPERGTSTNRKLLYDWFPFDQKLNDCSYTEFFMKKFHKFSATAPKQVVSWEAAALCP